MVRTYWGHDLEEGGAMVGGWLGVRGGGMATY